MNPLLLTSILLVSSPSLFSAVVVSQTQLTNHADYGSGYGQSFSMTSDGEIRQMRLSLLSTTGTSPFTINLFSFDSTAGTVIGPILATGSIAKNEITPYSFSLRSSPHWVDITFDVPYFAAAGDDLAFIIDHGSASFNLIGFSASAPYAGGYVFYFDGSRSPLIGSDLAFEVVTVPEPGMASCLIVGVGFCFCFSRRRELKT